MSPLNPYIDALILSEMDWGQEGCGRYLDLDGVVRVRPPRWDKQPYEKR